MSKDNMLVDFLKKESALISLMEMLEHFGVIKYTNRPRKTPKDELWISRYDVKVFCTEWVKTKGEQRRETSESNPWARLD
jgi:hypothetical protein